MSPEKHTHCSIHTYTWQERERERERDLVGEGQLHCRLQLDLPFTGEVHINNLQHTHVQWGRQKLCVPTISPL